MAQKKLIQGQPKFDDLSQYNFSNDEDSDFGYKNSTSLPKNWDKFQTRDLYTNVEGSDLNNAIIERNLKTEGLSSITIDNLYIKNAGVSGKTRSNDIKGYIFTQEHANADNRSYDDIKDLVATDQRFLRWQPGERNRDSDLGTAMSRAVLFDNFGAGVSTGDIRVDPQNNNRVEGGAIIPQNVMEIKDSVGNLRNTILIDENIYNPIYIVIRMKGNKNNNIGGDSVRKTRYTVFTIDNFDLFDYDNSGNAIGKITPLSDIPNYSVTGDGDGGTDSAAWKVGDLQVTINTTPGQLNDWTGDLDADGNRIIDADEAPYAPYFPLVQSPYNFDSFENIYSLLSISPSRQLNNTQPNGEDLSDLFPDYFPLTTMTVVGSNQAQNDSDLQSYYEFNSIGSLISSAPATISFDFKIVNPNDDSVELDIDYFYFVINWNDTDDRIKTLDDWNDIRPTDNFSLDELQYDNLYIPFRKGQNNQPTNTYTTPGIKNIKIIMFSYDASTKQIGRWKLITSRIYLDIPINQYPDFAEVGGSEYTTIPWPFTTPIIGGLSEDSKYKQSILDTLSGGNIGVTDVIDERFLINDLENDEMGKSINFMDLEQCRYFNTGIYNLYNLLNIDAVIDNELIQYNNSYYDGDINKFPMESSVGQIFISDNQDLDLKQSCKLELNMGELSDKSIYDSSGNSNKGLLIGDYKVKKNRKGEPMRRDSFIKVPKKANNNNGAL